jgi:hypothetical protein
MSTPDPTGKVARRRRTDLRSATVPFPDIDTIKAILGIDLSDTTNDAQLEALLNSTLAMLEGYCGRTLEEGDYTEEFAPIDSRDNVLMLRAWPTSVVTSVTRDGVALTDWYLDGARGMLTQYKPPAYGYRYWMGPSVWRSCRPALPVIVSYTGGYPLDAWPAALVDVLNCVIRDRWATEQPGGAGGIPVKGFTVDGLRVDYDVNDPDRGAEVKDGNVPPYLSPYAAQLAPFVDSRVYGA